MAATAITRGRLRRLAEVQPETGRVLSLFVDLDPSQFATAQARDPQLTSLTNEARKQIDAIEDLGHDERVALREDLDRIRAELRPERLGQGGVKGMAIFACGPVGLLEIMRLPHPIESRVVIGRNPHIEPLARMDDRERWAVVLVNRSAGRILVGDEDGLTEIENVEDYVTGQHKQGGWAQMHYQRGIEKEKNDHLDNVADELFRLFRFEPFDRLLVAGPEPIDQAFEARLHPYLRDRLVGRFQSDVENTSDADVLAAAGPRFEEFRRNREREAVERLRQNLNQRDGRAAAGLADVLTALNEQRVELLMLEPRASARGWLDPVTGFLAADPANTPREDAELVERDDVVEDAVERAVEQAADVMIVRHHPDLGTHGGIAALLRY